MSDEELSKEQRILRMMKRVLTDVAKDTHVPNGMRHPLSENTILGIRDCLGLITAREQELSAALGQETNMRPRFIDEPRKTVVVPIDIDSMRKKPGKEED